MTALLYVSNFLSHSLNRGYCEELADHLERVGCDVIRTSRQMKRFARLADMLATTWQQRHEYDVALVDVFSGAAFIWAESVCFELRRLDKPYVLTLHGGDLPGFARKWPRRVRRLLHSARFVTAPSAYLRTELAAYRHGIVDLRTGLETSAYKSVTTRQGKRLVWVRAFHEIYNPILAIEVLADLSRTDPTVALTMIGPDKGDGSLATARRRATELGVSHQLDIVGPVPKSEIPERLSAGDVFINTTNVDNTPISILEAMAAALPIVSTNVGGLPFLLEDQKTALLVQRDDARAMASAVRRLFSDEQLRNRLAQSARQHVSAYDWEAVIPEWQQLLSQARARA